ncbi:unnamed protein product [Cylicocyclus nassatus]|uniref:Uncharacterized protein n=1 Tax=Cylicocyclus nassatus TaxID=53992 RepID=A0AA36GT47_CYLNA|nr:unnamed protein product [Cylicocyclus nassatus]
MPRRGCGVRRISPIKKFLGTHDNIFPLVRDLGAEACAVPHLRGNFRQEHRFLIPNKKAGANTLDRFNGLLVFSRLAASARRLIEPTFKYLHEAPDIVAAAACPRRSVLSVIALLVRQRKTSIFLIFFPSPAQPPAKKMISCCCAMVRGLSILYSEPLLMG